LLSSTLGVALAFAATKLLLHLLTNGQYGYFRDELYFLACGDHLDWGYVDHAPLSPLVAKVGRLLFGDSLHAIRFLPALAGAAKVLLTGLMARELGGGRFAVALACLCVLVAPIYLGLDTIFSMNVFEPLFWMGCAYVAILAVKRGQPKLWIWFGVLAGLGLQNKHSMLFFGFALVAGLLLTGQRRAFRQKWIWIAGAIALAIFLPNLLWQYRHGWPTLEFLNNVSRTHKNVELAPPAFLWQQAVMLLPTTALVWVAGLWFFFFDTAGKRHRLLGWAYLVLLGVMIALKAKNYYVAPVYPMLFAAGGVLWEKCRPRWVKIALPAVVLVTGAIFAPLALPALPPESYVRYQAALGINVPKTEVHHQGKLPQLFGDMFGWPELVGTVAKVYSALPAEERGKAAILAGNYGEAGAIDFFGPRYGLPRAISRHNSYFLWGPRNYNGEVMIVLQASREYLGRVCASVEEAAVQYHPYGMAEENRAIHVCRGLKFRLKGSWPFLKHFQ